MATDIEQCKHDPRTEENEILLEVRQDIPVGKVLLCVFCGRDESAYRNEGAQFCVVMTNPPYTVYHSQLGTGQGFQNIKRSKDQKIKRSKDQKIKRSNFIS